MVSNIENVAANILKRAVGLDEEKRYTEAMVCYQEGIQLLLDCIKSIKDVDKKAHYRNKIESYMSHAEGLKSKIEHEKSKGTYHEQIRVEDGSTGHSYQSVFGRFLDSDVTDVLIEDPYIRTFHQFQNLLRLCELLVKRCCNLRCIQLITIECPNEDQQKWFQTFRTELSSKHKIQLAFQYSRTLHDRQIKLSNGWIIKIGRGLDYFKPPVSKFSLGVYDLDLRPCHETVIDVFHEKIVRMSNS